MKKIKSTKELRENQIIRVYFKGYGYATLSVVDVNNDFFSARGNREFISRLQKGNRMEAYLWSEKFSAYEFELEVLGTINDDLCIVFFKHSNEMHFSKERKCLIARVNLSFQFFVFDVAKDEKIVSFNAVEKLSGEIIQLSDREALLFCECDLPLGKYVKGHLNLIRDDIDIIARVTQSSEKNHYHLRFMGLHEREREKILQFVFDVYRE